MSYNELSQRDLDYLNGEGQSPHGAPLATKSKDIRLGDRLRDAAGMVHRVVTVTGGGVVAASESFPVACDGAPVQVSFAEDPLLASKVWAVWDGLGGLVVTVDLDPGANINVNLMVDCRSVLDIYA